MNRKSVRNCTALVILLVFCFATKITGSAIPMWEFLSRDEKISHLYKIFAKQASRFCSDSSSLPDCNKNLLIDGVRNLANMDENDLDLLDPYQRNADDIIWRAIVRNSRFATQYEHEDSYFASEDDPLATSESDHNGLGEESKSKNDYANPLDHNGPYLVGPMVIRVFPDGRPVPEDAKRPLPRDEDIEDSKYSKIPSVAEIEANGQRFFYNRPSYDSFSGSNRLNVYIPVKPVQRSNLVSANQISQYRRLNPIFRSRRFSEISKDARAVRFY